MQSPPFVYRQKGCRASTTCSIALIALHGTLNSSVINRTKKRKKKETTKKGKKRTTTTTTTTTTTMMMKRKTRTTTTTTTTTTTRPGVPGVQERSSWPYLHPMRLHGARS
jgi:hypothetical protein